MKSVVIPKKASELDKEDRLFHFRMTNVPYDGDDMSQLKRKRKRRSKRHVDNKLDLLKQDDRVDFVLPQKLLKREKRAFLDVSEELDIIPYDITLKRVKHRPKYLMDKKRSDLNDETSHLLNEILKEVENEDAELKYVNKRKKLLQEFDTQTAKSLRKDEIELNLPNEIHFNDQNYKEQWYLINDGQLKIPPMHDLNVRNAWLNGYTGKNVTIVIVDDGLDYEHPDFEGKYVSSSKYEP